MFKKIEIFVAQYRMILLHYFLCTYYHKDDENASNDKNKREEIIGAARVGFLCISIRQVNIYSNLEETGNLSLFSILSQDYL